MKETITEALIYENQGLRDEALEIYKNILKHDPNNQEARSAISRLSGLKRKNSETNEQIAQAVKYFNYRMFQWAKQKTVDGAVTLLKRHKQIKDELIQPFCPDFVNPAFDKAPKELIHYLSLFFNIGCEE